MLFSPPNEYDRQFVYSVVGITCCVHVILLVLFFVLEGYLLRNKPIIFDLKNMGSRVSMLSGPRKRPQAKKPVRKKAPVKKQPQKKAVKKKAPAKKVVAKKPVKKVVPKKPTKKTIPKKKMPTKATPAKKAPAKKVTKAPAKPAEPVIKEFKVADSATFQDKVCREIRRHLWVPPGIEFESFPVTFEINDMFKVVNIKPRGKEPLVIYTAIKEALLRSNMPVKNSRYTITFK